MPQAINQGVGAMRGKSERLRLFLRRPRAFVAEGFRNPSDYYDLAF
jgi:hypothetical protein